MISYIRNKKSHSKEIVPDYSCIETLHLYPFCRQMWFIHILQLVCLPKKGNEAVSKFNTSKFKSLKLPEVDKLVPHLTDKKNLQVRPEMY